MKSDWPNYSLSANKYKFQFAQALPHTRQFQGSGLTQKGQSGSKEAHFSLSQEREARDSGITIKSSFSFSWWHFPAALKGLLRKSTTGAHETQIVQLGI